MANNNNSGHSNKHLKTIKSCDVTVQHEGRKVSPNIRKAELSQVESILAE